ncbi:MAG: maleylpyruvate isomerase family mycothiol-dependent enzyme [Marmoricola sp.]
MTTTAVDPRTIPPIARSTDAARVAAAAYAQVADLLERLDPADWDRPTECAGWPVADVAGHLIGAMKACAKVREAARQQVYGVRHARQHEGNPLDALNALQVADHRALTPAERVAEVHRLAPAAVAGRMRLPAPVRRMSVPIAQTGSTQGLPARLNLGVAMDVVYTRDAWLHTIDIARATDREIDLAAPVNARVVADVVRDWAAAHGVPVELVLTGPAGGRFTSPGPGARLELDAVDFCRILSGRAPGEGLLAVSVVF